MNKENKNISCGKTPKLTNTAKKVIIGSVIAVLSLGFVGSIVGAIFGGDEFKQETQVLESKGIIKLLEPNYQYEYIEGEKFSFNKEENTISLIAKDPAIEEIVNIESLPGQEYGFKVVKTVDEEGNIVDSETLKPKMANEGNEETSKETSSEEETSEEVKQPTYTTTESDFIENASDIEMQPDMGDIYLVSKRYQNVRQKLAKKIYDKPQDSTLVNELVVEGEQGNIYRNDKLLSQEDLKKFPDAKKPYLTNVGTPISASDAEKLSGGACLRNFGLDAMKIEFVFYLEKDSQASLQLQYCGRKENDKFGNHAGLIINGEENNELDKESIYSSAGYFGVLDLPAITINLHKGINKIDLISGRLLGTGKYACNFDCLKLSAQNSRFCLLK